METTDTSKSALSPLPFVAIASLLESGDPESAGWLNGYSFPHQGVHGQRDEEACQEEECHDHAPCHDWIGPPPRAKVWSRELSGVNCIG